VSGVKKPNDKHLMLFSGRAYPELADEIAALMGVELVPTRALNYANSEIYVRFEESVRGSDAFVIQSHAAPVSPVTWPSSRVDLLQAVRRDHLLGMKLLCCPLERGTALRGPSRRRLLASCPARGG